MQHTLKFIISIFLLGIQFIAAQTTSAIATDTIDYREKYGLRLGIDISKPARTLLDENYTGFEIMGDYRVYKKYYAAVELGNEQKTTFDDNLTSKGNGSYIKIGFDYNSHNNWVGLHNAIHGGLRYGISSFKQELLSYTIATAAPFFPPDIREDPISFNGLNAQWVEFLFGVKTEILSNLYLSIHLKLKRRVSEKQPENFENLYIPGFGRTYEGSNFGAGFGYGISYLIPIYKK
ncbi:MAG: hypothetical protein COZ75_00110 [Flavobacteriaceae bacterium CG_4_8_14_3_um_filter_34_10]|nr:hypothetical protein [Flavobacteriia bacterium]OIP49079.1 MAG: hypothetical protein AUK33_11480 [Flavobacteriaceae bacterium CG2_30_34_30]PIQ17643.1 MAG: hypothetical protein COW66_10645 [Flavobacteriaceae bacterium CG18_big_fil_WC_8_21_14_2_50_34_36]PIV51360.1 MAG: hypothetical protein COS19_01525 [Flavobacteriaceae bacterium CG02_land_8_20_14_3_00_34_13]PIX10724.1 MAG: hypothetical protein COZ75_00110 [Flavobacteriaceae bacterium CG_4_8_14_3_um_filter_34_10]PIZ07202.1 MAG: hypothetical pr